MYLVFPVSSTSMFELTLNEGLSARLTGMLFYHEIHQYY